MDKVVAGNDIYLKTTPKEWESFVRVIEENGPFDIVVDGLNVAFASNRTGDMYSGQQIGAQAKGKANVQNVIISDFTYHK